MFKLVTCTTDHPKKLNQLRRTENLEALFNHYKDRPGFKEYIDAQFDFAKLSEMYLSARPNGYRKDSLYHENCAIKARLALLTYIVDIFFPTNKARPKRNKQMAQCEEIESLIDYTQPFMLNPDRQTMLFQYSDHTYKHLKDEHDWFNFEGLIAFKLIAAVDASSRGEEILVLPSFTELPERVGRLKPPHIVRKREKEAEEITLPPLKRRKTEQPVTNAPSTSQTSTFPLQTLQTLSELTQQDNRLSQYVAHLETLQAMIIGVSSSQLTPLSQANLITRLNALKLNLNRLTHYRDIVLYPALINDFNILPIKIQPFFAQQTILFSLKNVVDTWLIQLTAPVANQTAIPSTASSQEPPAVVLPTQQEQKQEPARDAPPPSSGTQNPETRSVNVSTNTSLRFFAPSSLKFAMPLEDDMRQYLEENDGAELFGLDR